MWQGQLCILKEYCGEMFAADSHFNLFQILEFQWLFCCLPPTDCLPAPRRLVEKELCTPSFPMKFNAFFGLCHLCQRSRYPVCLISMHVTPLWDG